MLRRYLSILVTTLTCLFGVAHAASAQQLDEIVTLTVEPGWQTDDGTWMAALRFTLAPGWKTYWRAPGDAGIPPHFTWSGESNIAAISVIWPVPHVFDQAGMRSIGYAGELVLPVEIWPRDDKLAPRLAGQVDIGVCQEICVPVQLDFDAPVGDLSTQGRRNAVVVAALVDQPLSAAEAGVGSVRCRISAELRGMEVTAEITMPPLGPREDVVVETGNPAFWVSEAEVRREGNILHASARVVPPHGASMLLERSAVRFTVLAEGRAVDIRGCQAF